MINFEDGEKTIHVVRKHWFVMLGFGIILILLAILPAIIFGVLFSESAGSYLNTDWRNYIPMDTISEWFELIYPLWLLAIWIFFFIEWTDYYLDIWIITNKRIIDVEQQGFFHREITSFSFNQVQDITVETRGVVQTMFKFGLLHVQTAGHNRNIVIKHADNPEEVRSIILRQQSLAFERLGQ